MSDKPFCLADWLKMSYLMWNRVVLTCFIKNQQSENIRLARKSVTQAPLDSSARFETTLSLELEQAQCNNESTMQQRGRDIFLRHGSDGSRSTSAAKSPHGARATSTRSGTRMSNKFRCVSEGIGATSIFGHSRIRLKGS